MLSMIRNAIMTLLAFTILTGIIYPLAVTGIAQVAFPVEANGSIIMNEGRPVGSALIGQHFDDPKYFWGRPSATAPYPYNGASSSGSNLGPNNPDLIRAVRERITALHRADPDNTAPIPADLVTTSASGLDPHISPASAVYQARRIARLRDLEEPLVAALLAAYTEPRQLGIFGEPVVNVLRLNLALDEFTLKKRQAVQR